MAFHLINIQTAIAAAAATKAAMEAFSSIITVKRKVHHTHCIQR